MIPTAPLVFGLTKPTRFYETSTRQPVVDFSDIRKEFNCSRLSTDPATGKVLISNYSLLGDCWVTQSDDAGDSVETFPGNVAKFIPAEIEEGAEPTVYLSEGAVEYDPPKGGQVEIGSYLYDVTTWLKYGVLHVRELYIEQYPGQLMKAYCREFVFANPPDSIALWGLQGYTDYVWAGTFQRRDVVRGHHLGLPE